MTPSVVIPTRDRPTALRGCLVALAAQDAGGLDVVVVDDGSRDRHALDAVVADALPDARVVRTPGRGPAAARNLGARAAEAEVVLFTD
ncbi:MAG TPA: glycosyltransferase family 2 protein, partial [Solirubrobacterales bacterium]|nr:glycosyltransferase family 2 protein [Solirubrobacterales bacterium]